MDKTKKNTVPISKLGTLVFVTFALVAGGAGRAKAASNTPAVGPLDDPQIAQRVLALNRAEERTADAVKGKLSSPAVWQLAQRMSVDHAVLDQKFRSLGAAKQSSTGDATAGDASDVDLSKLSGDALEKAYVAREVKSHETMLAALDRQLIPNAKSEELQRQLIDLRAEVAAHLDNAKSVQHVQSAREMAAQERELISREIGNSGPFNSGP